MTTLYYDFENVANDLSAEKVYPHVGFQQGKTCVKSVTITIKKRNDIVKEFKSSDQVKFKETSL